MRYIANILKAALISIVFVANGAFAAQSASAAKSGEKPAIELTQKELEKLAQPIALYPDLLLQQVLAASTFPEQLLDAAIYNEQGNPPEEIKNQPWDESVKGVANYPSILSKLASDLDWTIALGSAFINQNKELRTAIQTLRSRAEAVGNLKDTEQQNVIEEKTQDGTTIIRIEPTDTQVVYVPTTTTSVVYDEPVQTSSLWAPVASFGVGMALGYAMGDDDDDHYYGGYYGPGFWGGSAADDWVDYRQDRWDDAYDFANDRQSWRQDNRDDWREYRQDLGRKQQDWKNEAKNRASNMSPEQRAQASSKLNSAKASWQGKTPEQRQQAVQNRSANKGNVDSSKLNQAKQNAGKGSFSRTGSANYGSLNKSDASQRLSQAKSNPQFQQRANNYKNSPAVQQRAQSAKSNYQSRSSGGSSYSRGSGLSGMSSGSRSVSSAYSRGSASRSYSGGGFSRSSSGFSRGGGGGGFSRGGGGGGRRR